MIKSRFIRMIIVNITLISFLSQEAAIPMSVFSTGNNFKLSPPLMCNKDIGDVHRLNISKIRYTLQSQLKEALKKSGQTVDNFSHSSFVSVLKKLDLKDETIFNPVKIGIKTFPHESEPIEDGVLIKCRAENENGKVETYFAAISREKTFNDEFVIEKIYTKKEYDLFNLEKRKKSKKIFYHELPQRQGLDGIAIDRYVNVGEKIDNFIRKKIEKGDFSEIESTADSDELKWDGRFPYRRKPDAYIKKSFF